MYTKSLLGGRMCLTLLFRQQEKTCLKGEGSGIFSTFKVTGLYTQVKHLSVGVSSCRLLHGQTQFIDPRGVPGSPNPKQVVSIQLAQSYLFFHPIPPCLPKTRPAQTQFSWVKADVPCKPKTTFTVSHPGIHKE